MQDQSNKTDVIGLHDGEFKLHLLCNAQKDVFAESRAARRLSRKIPSINEPVLVDIQGLVYVLWAQMNSFFFSLLVLLF